MITFENNHFDTVEEAEDFIETVYDDCIHSEADLTNLLQTFLGVE